MNNWKKSFYTIWAGQAFSQLSSSILQFAIVWYLTDTTKSGIVLSMAMLMGFLPQGILGPFIGVYIDRFSRKKIMVLADLAIAGVSLVLVFATVDGKVATWVVLGVLFFRAIGTAFHAPTLQAVTPQLVPQEELTKCAGYTQSLQSISMILSPAIAAVLYSAWNLSAIVLLDVLGALIAVVLVAVCKIPKYESAHKDTRVHMMKEA
ncbi:MAG: MFS transporter, partial [Lachnospiraceae bacterium]